MTTQVLPKFSYFEHFADGQMFLCNTATEQECLDRLIFGSPRSKWSEIQQINERTTAIFLYSIGDQPTLHGLFTAVGRPFLDMETSAFGGRFPSQVRVKRFFKFPPIPGSNVKKIFRGDRNRQRRLTRQQTHEILARAISYMWNQSDAGDLQRLSKQRKNESVVGQFQPPLMNSGTPIYIYNPTNSLVSFPNKTSSLPSNTKGGVFNPLTSCDVLQSERNATPSIIPIAVAASNPQVMTRTESRNMVLTGCSIRQGASNIPPFLYFPVLPQSSRTPLESTSTLVTKLYAGNLHKSISSDCLRACFSYFGKVLDSGIQTNQAGLSLGSGWVEFENPNEAARAVERVNGMLIAGLKVIVCPWSEGIV